MLQILVVDDSSFLHSIFRVSLRRFYECEISYAKNGLEALACIEEKGEPDLVLLDVNMPVMGGLELLDELRRGGVLDRLPVIVISTEGEEADVLRGLEAGARGYLRKPFTEAELQDIIGQVMDK